MLERIFAWMLVVGVGATMGCSSVGKEWGEEGGNGGGNEGGAAGGPGGAGGETVTCTARGCGAAFTATQTVTSADLPPGMYRVDVTADGVPLSCTFDWPQDPTGGFRISSGAHELSVTVFPTDKCWIEKCDQFVETIQFLPWENPNPAEIRIQQSVDGVPMLDRTFQPSYTHYFANGPKCGPSCYQASVDLTPAP